LGEKLSPYLALEDIDIVRFLKPVVLPYLQRHINCLRSETYDAMVLLLASGEFRKAAFQDKIPFKMAKELLNIDQKFQEIIRHNRDWMSEKLKIYLTQMRFYQLLNS
jgi:hypothetical protein